MTRTMDQITADAAAHVAVLERMHRDLTGLSATARADDGRVIVRVDATGALVELALLAGAGHGDAARLGTLIVEAAVAAARELISRRAELTAEFLREFDDSPDAKRTRDVAGATNP